MVFKGSNGAFRLVKMSDYKTEKGRVLYFVTLADLVTFENCNFVLDSEFNEPSRLVTGSDYDVVLVVEGKYSKVQLVPITNKK